MDEVSTQTISPTPHYALPSASRILGDAFRFYSAHWLVIGAIAIIPVIVSLPQILLGEKSPGLVIVFAILAFIIGFLSRIALFVAVTENGEPSGGVMGAFSHGLHFLIPFIWVSALVSLTTIGGLFLLFIPGLLLSIWLSLSLYVLFSENYRGTSALVASWHYVKGYWLSVFWRFLFFGIVLLLIGLVVGFITAGLSLITIFKTGGAVKPEVSFLGQLFSLLFNNLLVIPLSIIYSYLIYRSLKEIKASVSIETDAPKLKKAVTIFMIIGIIGLIALIVLAGFLLIRFLPQFLQQGPTPTSFQIPASSLLASMGFSPLLNFLPFGR